jgi:quercetin dioxygenase-like cupin family protein
MTMAISDETDPSYDYHWHPAPQRQYIIMLEGELEVEAGDGTKRLFSPGDILLVEDTTGRGHRSRTTNNEVRKTIFVTLD